jgi:hypothetical protein
MTRGDADTDSRSGSAAERQAFFEQLANGPDAMLFLFADVMRSAPFE